MKGYCESCKKRVQGVKKQLSWLSLILWCLTGFGIVYIIYRLLFCGRKRCPICGLKIRRRNNEINL